MKILIWDFDKNKVIRKEIFFDTTDYKLEKRKKSGLRKCKGHKLGTYLDENNKCFKCGGYDTTKPTTADS